MDYVLYELPAIQLAMLWRMFVQGNPESKTGTLLDGLLNEKMKEAGFYG